MSRGGGRCVTTKGRVAPRAAVHCVKPFRKRACVPPRFTPSLSLLLSSSSSSSSFHLRVLVKHFTRLAFVGIGAVTRVPAAIDGCETRTRSCWPSTRRSLHDKHPGGLGYLCTRSTSRDDFTAVSSALRQYLPERDTPFILDIDLDFFSTKNPFKTLYSRINLYDKLAPIYAFNRPDSTDPESVKQVTAARNEQLTELQNLFDYLEEHRSLQGYEGEKSARYEAVELIYRELTSAYKQSEIDWKIIHDAGCTRDDTDLPHHVTTPNDLDRLISGTFRSFLAALPVPPTIVTIARSSDDDYCPLENVDQIQIGVLDELRQYLGEVDVQLAYEDEEEVH